jgi:hypothetical protein
VVSNITFFKKSQIYGTDDTIFMTRYTILSCKYFSVKIHKFYRSDNDIMHDHPWNFISIILKGGYYEETKTYKKWFSVGSILKRKAEFYHKVILPEGKTCLSLVFAGPKKREWGFDCSNKWVSSKDFFNKGCNNDN